MTAAFSCCPGDSGADGLDGTWTNAHDGPPSLAGAQGVLDSRRGRLIVTGGNYYQFVNFDTYAFDLQTDTWKRLKTAGTPPTLIYAGAVYDSIEDRVLVFGGQDAGTYAYSNRLWALSLAGVPTWTELTPGGEVPSPRIHSLVLLDEARGNLLVHGGRASDSRPSSELYVLPLRSEGGWKRMWQAGVIPPARYGHSGIFDDAHDAIVIWSGTEGSGPFDGEWVYRLPKSTLVWERWPVSGPEATMYARAVHDRARARLIQTGGGGEQHTWALNLVGAPQWSRVTDEGLVSLRWFVAIVDPSRDRVVVTGGGQRAGYLRALNLAQPENGWTLLAEVQSGPGTDSHTATWDAFNDRMYLFAGWDVTYRNDLWSWSPTEGWNLEQPVGSPPQGRVLPAWALVPIRHSLWVFGGALQNGVPLGDLWELRLPGPPTAPEWHPVASYGTPAPRYGHTMTYSPSSNLIMLYGSHQHDPQVHLLTPGFAPRTWQSHLLPGPAGRSSHSAVFDSRRNRALIFGGTVGGDECWAYDFLSNTWSRITWSGESPGSRYLHQAFYDAAFDRMVIFGGVADGSSPFDVWSLELSGVPYWRKLETTGYYIPLSAFSGAFDPLRGHFYIQSTLFFRLGLLGPYVSVPAAHAEGTTLRASPNPSSTGWEIQYAPSNAGPIVVELFDLQGRRVERKTLDGLRGDPVRTTLGASVSLAPGVYLAVVRDGTRLNTTRLVRMH